jgi:PAS domain S-box-containing protein
MRIRRFLYVGLAVTVALVGANIALTEWYSRKVQHMDDVQGAMLAIALEVTSLQMLGLEYLMHPNPRIPRQWRVAHQNFLGLLEKFPAQSDDEKLMLQKLMDDAQALPLQFELLQKIETDPALDAELLADLREAVSDQLMLQVRNVSAVAYFEVDEFSAERRAVISQQRMVQVLSSSAVLLLIAIAVLYAMRRVLLPIERLEKLARRVQAGDLDVRSTHHSRDEIGGLSQSFDAMTTALQKRDRATLAAQRETQALLSTLHQQFIVSTANELGEITACSEAFCRISGYSKSELLGQDHRIVNSGVHGAEFWAGLWGKIASGESWRGDICNRAKDGSLYWLDSMIAPFLDAHGNVEQYISIRTDITTRKADQILLQESEAVFSASFENGAICMAVLTADGNVLRANAALCEFLGYAPQELFKMSLHDVVHPDEMPADIVQMDKLLGGEMDVYQRSKRFVHRDGHIVWGTAGMAVVRHENGEPRYLIAQISDITARKRTEEALRVTAALLETSQSIAKVGGWELSLENNAMFWTAQVFRIFEVSPDDFEPTLQSGVKFLLPESIGILGEAMRMARDTGQGYDLELRAVTATGRPIDVRTTGLATVLDGRAVKLTGILQDITEIKEYQRSLQEARKVAEAATQSKGQFLANMSHEIRTPMNAILGMLKLLHHTDLNARQLDYATKSESAARSLLGLINDILDFSKVEAGKMTLDLQPFLVDRLMRDVSVILSSNVGSKGIDVLYDIDPALPKVLMGDSMRLQQILINLGGNAVKFTSQGQVVVALRLQQQDAHCAQVKIAVTDSGIGIAPENMAHIFDGFSQAEASTTRKFGGTGLGLAISKRLIEVMGGELVLTSELGVGSTFAFTLQLPLVKDVPVELQASSRLDMSPRRVLVVDDNPVAANMMADMVRSWQWPCDVVGSGAQALELIQTQMGAGVFPYQIIYLDWHMPEMDGWETAKRIGQLITPQAAAKPPALVMVTARTRETLAQRTLEEQARLTGFLVKPFTSVMLREAAIDAHSTEFRLRKSRRGGANQRSLTGMRILVVEDNLINQQVAEELLMSQGALVSLAANGQLGVDAVLAAKPPFHAVLMDIQMPVMDGYSATRAIRMQPVQADLPIIAMTANAMASDREACLAAGMNDHVGKPFELDKLVATLIQWTGFETVAQTQQIESMPQTNEVVQPVAGIDVSTALNRMSGLKSLYVRSARAFCQSLPTLAAEFRAAVETDLKAASMQMHTLKGTAALLGAGALSAEASRLEKWCNQSPVVQDAAAQTQVLALLTTQTASALAEVIVSLEEEPLATSTPGGGLPANAPVQLPLNLPAVKAALAELMPLLAVSDLSALDLFAQHRTVLEGLGADQLAPLEDAMQALDLDVALTVCQTIQSQLTSRNA